MSDETNKYQKELTEWLNGDITDAQFEKEIGKADFSKYSQILNEVGDWQPSIDSDVLDPKSIINKEGKSRSLSTWQYFSIAASIALVFTIGFLIYQNFSVIEYSAGFGEIKEVLLPDGKSKVILGPNSSIAFKKRHWKKEGRQISLSGKAHFDVAKGGPFKVETTNGMVEVLGTQFDVSQFDENLQVICYEGKVRATSNSNENLIISGGESSILFDNAWEEKRMIKHSTPDWIQDEVNFDNVPITLVIKELKSLFDITFDLGEVNLQRRFTGAIPKNNLNQSLQIVFGTLSIEYRIEGKKVILND